MAMLKALSHEDINDRSLDEHTLPPMLNPALLGSEETTLGSAMDHSCAVLSTSQFMRRSNMGAAASTTPSALRAPTPRAAASFVGEPFAQRSHKLTPLQAEVRRIRDHQIGRPGSAAAGDTEAAPMYLESMDIAAAADVSPMQLGSVPALSPMHLGEIPLHVVVRNTSRPLTPSMNADGTHFTLPLPHHTTCVGLAEPEVVKDATPTSNATPTPGWAAPAIRAQAASSFRREGHGRAKEQVVQHHRVVLNSPVATPSSTGGCVPPLYSPPRDSSVVLQPSLRHGSGTITMWPPHSSFGHLHPNANSTDAFKSPCSETAPPSSTSQHSDGGRLPAPTTTAVPGVAWLSDSSSEGDHC